MKAYRIVFFALWVVSSTTKAMGLSELERYMLSHDQRLEMARQNIRIAQARLVQKEAKNGWSLMATTTGGNVEDSGINTSAYGYSVGASYPLLGTRSTLQKQVDDAHTQIEIAQTKSNEQIIQSLTDLRQAYVDQWCYGQEAQLARAFLSERNQDMRYLTQRFQQKLLLQSDEQTVQNSLAEADAQAHSADQLAGVAYQKLAILTGLTTRQLQDLDMPRLEVKLQNDKNNDNLAPNVRLAQQVLEEQQHHMQNPMWKNVDASVSFGYSDGHNGLALGVPSRSAQVALNVRIPLEIDKLKKGLDEEAEAQLDKDRADYGQSKTQFALDAKQALAEYDSALSDVHTSNSSLLAARQALHERNLRSRALLGDEVEKRLQARYTYYQAARQQLDRWKQWQLASIKLASLGFSLQKTDEAPPTNIAEPLTANSNSKIQNPPVAMGTLPQKESSTATGAKPPFPKEETSSDLIKGSHPTFVVDTGSYMWKSETALQNPEAQVKEWLRYGLTRLLIGLNRKQIEDPALASRIARLVHVAHRNHIKIEALLGDPNWILPAARPELIAILHILAPLPIDGVNLDLEIEQLPQWQQRRHELTEEWLNTLKEAAEAAPWPLTATFHYRHLDMPELGSRLFYSGVAKAAVMIFSTNSTRVLDVAQHAHQTFGNFPFAIVQSVEHQLPPSESYAHKGLTPLIELSHQLQQQGQTTLLLQSWEDLRMLQP